MSGLCFRQRQQGQNRVERHTAATGGDQPWWREAVVYELYTRSFADGDGDGVGDLVGATQRIGHLAALGVDAVWLCPHYPSPLRDGGYDVSDHRAVHPQLGTLADFDAFVDAAHGAGIRVIVDLVPNHTSDEHPWFKQARATPSGHPARDRYHVVEAPDGDQPPNNWQSVFGGPAWSRLPDGSWYLHLFDSSQPDLNWDDQSVLNDSEETLRFWLDHGVDGFRVDVASGLVKEAGYPDAPTDVDLLKLVPGHDHPHWDRPETHHIARRWRSIIDEVDRPVLLLAEAWVGPKVLGDYIRADEYHQAFNFDFLFTDWDADQMRRAIDLAVGAVDGTEAMPTWILSNHDVMRAATRFGLPPGTDIATWPLDGPADLLDPARGRRRALAAALLIMALPGSVYLYQGEELALPDVWDLPIGVLQDPTFERSGRTRKGRDGCRVPIPWDHSPAFGFSAGKPWLPQPDTFADHTVHEQSLDPTSPLALYRHALRLRSALLVGAGTIDWIETGPEILSFRRGDVTVVCNLGSEPIDLPPGKHLIASSPSEDRALADSAVWILTPSRGHERMGPTAAGSERQLDARAVR